MCRLPEVYRIASAGGSADRPRGLESRIRARKTARSTGYRSTVPVQVPFPIRGCWGGQLIVSNIFANFRRTTSRGLIVTENQPGCPKTLRFSTEHRYRRTATDISRYSQIWRRNKKRKRAAWTRSLNYHNLRRMRRTKNPGLISEPRALFGTDEPYANAASRRPK